MASMDGRMALLVGLLCTGCTSGVCPTIGCYPTITLTYDMPIAGSYTASVTVNGSTVQSTCPRGANGDVPGIASCDALGLKVSGVDLGHGSLQTVPVTVSINGGAAVSASASLAGIANSRDCDVVCYQHVGVVKVAP